MAIENKVGQFKGGNDNQRNHLNALVDLVNSHEDWRDKVDSIGPDNILETIVVNADGTRLSKIQIQDAHHIADMGPFDIKSAVRMHPWQPFITRTDLNVTGQNKDEDIVTTNIAWIDFNPLSTLWAYKGVGDNRWGAGAERWTNELTIENFGTPIPIANINQAVWLKVTVSGSMQCSCSLQGGELQKALPVVWPPTTSHIAGSEFWEWETFPEGGAVAVNGGGGVIYHLLCYFREPIEGETADFFFTPDSDVGAKMIATTHTNLILGVWRYLFFSGTQDYMLLMPWFRTYNGPLS
jgi:hypothetical protein